jgi:hypothetical protein
LTFGILGRRWALGKWAIGLGVVALALGIWGAVIVNNATNKLNHDLNQIESSINNVPSFPVTTP